MHLRLTFMNVSPVPLLCVYYSGIYNDKAVLMELMNIVVFPPEMNTRT